METVSKYSLNPLATCFVPSSMKNQSIGSTAFPIVSYESSVHGLWVTKNGLPPVVGNSQKSVPDYFGVTKGGRKVLSNPARETTINEEHVVPAVKVKEILSNSLKEDVSTEGHLTTKEHLTVSEGTGKIPEKIDGKKISERRSKKRIGFKDKSLAKLDNARPKQILGKISKFLHRGTTITKILSMVWPFAIQSMLVTEFFYRIRFNPVSLDLALSTNLYAVFKSNRNTTTYPKSFKKTNVLKDKAKSDECHCPSMFGWIVPLEYFGNPLKLAKTCCKDYVHTNVDGSSRQPQKSECFVSEDKLSLVNDEVKTLEQCSSELKAVIKDVCDSLSLSYDQSSEESNKTKVSKTRKRPVWEIETGKKLGTNRLPLEVIDDGFHPLLEEISSVDTDDTDMTSIQKLLGEALSHHKKVSSEQEILSSQSDCNLPCSIWCNKVPPPAKDTYKRFIRKSDLESTVHRHVNDAKRKVLKKPIYRRCFSADDTPKSSDSYKMPLLAGSDFESRERIMLLRRDPIAFIKQSGSATSRDCNRKSRSNASAVSEKVSAKDYCNEIGSDKWSFYDGADSLWQPLPDCIPLGDSAQRHSHKKARDMRRQKSVC